MARLTELEARRAYECRLTPDRALESLEDAADWVRERGLVTLTPCCSLPSLHVAIHEEPYAPGGRGFAAYPRTKWWWGGALAARDDLHFLKIHRGKGLLVSDDVARFADPLCRAELERAEAGARGEGAARLVEHLASAGPTLVDDLKLELGADARTLRSVRTTLERLGAVVARSVRLESAGGGHRHTSELLRWDQLFPAPSGVGGVDELVGAGLRAAVLAPPGEPATWFPWSSAPDRGSDERASALQ